ncbi:MAG: hypothetical protein H6978_00220 [Gammaproteobacteria bacterium]|nr:hypothetical protein [Gammaproteobacteria bacterium]
MNQPESSANPSRKRQRLMLVSLFALFAAPIVIAWLLVSGLLPWHAASLTNRGTLLQSPVQLTDADLGEAANDVIGFNGTWTLWYFGDGACDDTCVNDLVNIDKIHQLVGHSQERMRVRISNVPLPADANGLNRRLLVELSLPDATLTRLATNIGSQSSIVPPFTAIVDHQGYLAMVYGAGSKPDDVLYDLKKLLRASDPG